MLISSTKLGATDEQLDFPVIYTSAIQGISGFETDQMENTMHPLLDMIIDKVPSPDADIDNPFQLQISARTYLKLKWVINVCIRTWYFINNHIQ